MERFLHPYERWSIPLSNQCGISQSAPLWGSLFSIEHRPVLGSDTIHNSLRPSLVDVVCFGPLCITIRLTVLKRVY